VFESKPLLGDGLSQIERQIYHFEGGVLNSASLALSTDEKSELNTWINKDKNDSYYLPFIADKKRHII
jgi:alkyl hydroperoxide reductase subunit AhpC